MGEDGYSYGDEEDQPSPNNMEGMGGMDDMGMEDPYMNDNDESP